MEPYDFIGKLPPSMRKQAETLSAEYGIVIRGFLKYEPEDDSTTLIMVGRRKGDESKKLVDIKMEDFDSGQEPVAFECLLDATYHILQGKH